MSVITIDADKVAQELTDNDKLYKVLKATKLYVEQMRESTEYKQRYEYYVEILKSHAHIKG